MAYTPSGNPTNQSRGLAATIRAEFALIAAAIAELAANAVQTLTNKTIALGSNTVSGTKAQFNTACTDGEFIYDGGALGTPSSGVLTNCTGTAAGLTAGAVAVGGVTGLGTGVATFLATPSSANLQAALTDETGSGVAVFATAPTIANPVLTGTVDLSSASSGQIKFPASQNASSDANTLDDYEEGTWTPAWTFSSSGSVTYASAIGNYTKIGRQVTLSGRLVVGSLLSPVGEASITGLPFTPASYSAACVFGQNFSTTNANPCSGEIASGSSAIRVLSSNGIILTSSSFTGALDAVSFSATYFV